jgi:hypothetical protein
LRGAGVSSAEEREAVVGDRAELPTRVAVNAEL